jgi:hypothetical protein
MPMAAFRSRSRRLGVALLAAGLYACGGDDMSPPAAATIQLTQTHPAEHTGRLTLADGASATNEWRGPDVFSPEPYCLLRYTGLRHDDGKTYVLAVAFGAADRRVLALTLTHRDSSWFVAAFNPPAAQATVDLARRTVLLRQARSTQGGQAGWDGTLDGSAGFGPAPGNAACG